MKHQTNAPKFCLFLLLCLFSYSAVTAKAENKSKERIAQSSLLSSVSNFTSITAMALPIKAASFKEVWFHKKVKPIQLVACF